MKDKHKLLHEKQKIEMELKLEEALDRLDKAYRGFQIKRKIGYAIQGLTILLALAGYIACYFILPASGGFMRTFVLFGYLLGVITIVMDLIRSVQRDNLIIREHKKIMEEKDETFEILFGKEREKPSKEAN